MANKNRIAIAQICALVAIVTSAVAQGATPAQDVEPTVTSETQTVTSTNAGAETAAVRSSSFYFAPAIGLTSASQSNGATDRESYLSYGGEAYFLVKHFMTGLNYTTYQPASAGTLTVNVKQDNQWISAQANYRLLDDDITPYAGAGVGAIFKSVTTQVMGNSENASGAYLAPDLGLGLFGRISANFGFNCGIKYYWYSNVTGWDYTVSIGFLTN